MEQALSHQESMMQRLMDTVSAVESFEVHDESDEILLGAGSL